MTQKKEENIKTDYLNGMRYKDIYAKHNITLSDLQRIIHKYKLTRDKKKILKGNKNAKNGKGGHAPQGNKNAVTTGEFEKIYKDVLTESELEIYQNYKIDNTYDSLLEQYLFEYKLLVIREKRMLQRIGKIEQAEKDMILKSIKKKNNEGNVETSTEAESTIDKIQRIEDGLTRVEESKRKCRENMIKLGFNKRELELKERQAEEDIW